MADDYRSRITTAPGGIGTLQLGPQAYIDPRDQRYVHDAYQYFLNQQGGGTGGGQDAATMPPITPSAAPVTTGGAGDQGLAVAPGITGTSAAQNMGGAQNPLTQIPVGQTQTVKQLMTGPEAYNITGQMPKTPVSGVWGPQDYLQPETSDPFLTSGAAGGARLSSEQQDPAWWENARDRFLETGQDVGNAFKGLKDQGMDIVRMGGSAIANAIAPGLGFLLNMTRSASGPQQKLVADQFRDEGVAFDDVGRIQQVGTDYNTPENVMAGYNPGETGMMIPGTDFKIGGNIIQQSIVDRMATIDKSLAKYDKYDPTHEDYDAEKAQQLIDRKEALKENLNMVARAAGGVTLEDWKEDQFGKRAGEVIYGSDYFPPLGQEDAAPTTIEDINPDYFLGHSRLTRQYEPGEEIWTPGKGRKVKTITPFDPKRIADTTSKVGLSQRGKIDRRQSTLEEALGTDSAAERAMQEQIAIAEAEQRVKEENERAARAREENELAARAREENAQRVRDAQAAERAAAASREAAAAAAQARDRHRGDGGGGFSGAGAGTGASGPPGRNYAKGGLIRQKYGTGGIVDLL